METLREDGRYGSITLRPYQIKAINFILETLRKGKHPIIQAPTGSGKTLIGLFSSILYSMESGKKIIYLTRTNSQQANIIKEMKRIRESIQFKSVVMQGRINLCPLYREIEEEREFSAESLSRMCSARKKRTVAGKDGGCRFYNERIRDQENVDFILNQSPSPEDLFLSLSSRGICPYESIKYAMKDAQIVVMPYAYFISPDMAINVLYNMRSSRESVVVVADEAHNLPDMARQVNSFEITWNMIDLSEKESVEYGDPEIMPRIRISDFTESIRSAFIDMTSDMGEQEERRIMFRDIYSNIAMSGRYDPEDVYYMVDALSSFGEVVEKKKEEMGKVPMSHLSSLSSKLKFLQYADDERYVCILKKGLKIEEMSVEAYCLDPSIVLEQMKRSLTLSLSATIEPIHIFLNMTGFTDSRFMDIGNIFPEKNLLTIYSTDLTTKFEEFDLNMESRIGDAISRILLSNERRKIVLFPSFRVMDRILRRIPESERLGESRNMKSTDFNKMIGTFREKGGVMFGVIGGRMSEGIDLPGELLEILVIVGIPFPKPDIRQRILSSYYEHLYGNGWEYAFFFPALVKLKQAIGRVIRSENDRGVVIILDNRIEMFREYIKCSPAGPDFKEIGEFFGDSRSGAK